MLEEGLPKAEMKWETGLAYNTVKKYLHRIKKRKGQERRIEPLSLFEFANSVRWFLGRVLWSPFHISSRIADRIQHAARTGLRRT